MTAQATVKAELRQMNGLSLIIQPCSAARVGCMRVCLSGAELQATAYVASIASSPDNRACWQYFKAVARIEGEQTYHWLSECQDLNFSASIESAFPDQILLSVHLGSSSDDDCDWQINGTLLLSSQQIDDFAEALKGLAL